MVSEHDFVMSLLRGKFPGVTFLDGPDCNVNAALKQKHRTIVCGAKSAGQYDEALVTWDRFWYQFKMELGSSHLVYVRVAPKIEYAQEYDTSLWMTKVHGRFTFHYMMEDPCRHKGCDRPAEMLGVVEGKSGILSHEPAWRWCMKHAQQATEPPKAICTHALWLNEDHLMVNAVEKR